MSNQAKPKPIQEDKSFNKKGSDQEEKTFDVKKQVSDGLLRKLKKENEVLVKRVEDAQKVYKKTG